MPIKKQNICDTMQHCDTSVRQKVFKFMDLLETGEGKVGAPTGFY
jgi:hypothetical protein